MVDSGESKIAMQQSKKESRAVRRTVTRQNNAAFFNFHSGQVIVQSRHVTGRVRTV
jgi:hypothetical protein